MITNLVQCALLNTLWLLFSFMYDYKELTNFYISCIPLVSAFRLHLGMWVAKMTILYITHKVKYIFQQFHSGIHTDKQTVTYSGIFYTVIGFAKSLATSGRPPPILIVSFTCVFLNSLHQVNPHHNI